MAGVLYSSVPEKSTRAIMYDTPPSDELFWPEAAAKVAEIISKVPCDRKKFIDIAIRHCLPVYATTPMHVEVASWTTVDGKRVSKSEYSARGGNALLLPNELLQLEYGGGPVVVTQVALDFEDELYIDWSTVKAQRDAEHRVDHIRPAFNHGRWMGQTDAVFFPNQVVIRDNSGMEVPFHTIQAVAEILSKTKADRSQDATAEIPAVIQAEAQHAAFTKSLRSSQTSVKSAPVRGITKDQVLQAFAAVVKINLEKALGNGKGLYGGSGARVQRGSTGRRQRTVSLWNPVILAVGLYEQQGVPLHQLKRIFRDMEFLWPWEDDWKEQTETMG